MSDPLAGFDFGGGASGLFTKFKSGSPVKVRVLTTDPLVVLDKFGNTRYAFIIWNFTEDKAQILNRGSSIASEIQKLHNNVDWGNDVQKIDIQIEANGEGKETRYTVTPLPKATQLTPEQIAEAKKIDLTAKLPGGIRLSKFIEGDRPEAQGDEPAEETSGYEQAKAQADRIRGGNDVPLEDINDDEPIDLSEIPF